MAGRVQQSGGMSGRESRAFRKDVRSGLAEAERRAYRARIAKLDAELAHVRAQGAKRVKTQRDRCGAEYQEAQRKARSEIERARAERDHKRTSCAIEAEHVKAARVSDEARATGTWKPICPRVRRPYSARSSARSRPATA